VCSSDRARRRRAELNNRTGRRHLQGDSRDGIRG
jgi:hypothetical protein